MSKIWGSKWSLQTRILILTVVISASLLAVTDKLTTLSSVRAVENAMVAQTNNVARRLADELERLPATNLPIQFQDQVLDVLELEPNIIRVDIYADFDGELKLVGSIPTHEDRALEGQEVAAFYSGKANTFMIQEGSARRIFSVYPLQFSDGRQGFVTVVSTLQVVDDIMAAHSRIRLYSMVATTILLVAAITLLFRTTVYRSVRHLVDVMHRFKKGEASARAEENLADEFGELARNFNGMLEEIQRFNDHLQQGIKAATEELAARNRELQKLNLQLYETQKRLTQAERLALAGQLTATFVHEIGSPLSAISTHLQMLLENSHLDPQVRARLHLVNDQIDRVCRILEDLLTTTRQTSRRVPVELKEIIRKVIHLLGPTLESRQVRFSLEGSGGPCLIEGDPDQLQQLFLNLFNNSIDAIRGSGTLCVKIRCLPPAENGMRSYFQIDVSDSGVGISAEKLDHIFEPFFTTKEFRKGTGLGLAVSKEIVDRHGGHISVISTLGKGTCFTILLPKIQTTESNLLDSLAVKEVNS